MKKLLLLLALLFPLSTSAITCTKYLRSSDGSDSDDGSTWALAYATLDYALGQVSSGDTICMDDDHQESWTVSKTFTASGTAANPTKVIVVTTDTTTPVSTYPASYNLRTTTAADLIAFTGFVYLWGINLEPYDILGINTSGASARLTIENSLIFDRSGDSGSGIRSQSDSGQVILIDTDLKDGNVYGVKGGRIEWRGGTYLVSGSGVAPYLIYGSAGAEGSYVYISGVDLSAWNGSTALINNAYTHGSQISNVQLISNKLPSSVTLSNGTADAQYNDSLVFVEGSGNADEYYQFYRNYYAGTVEQTTSIYRTNGSTYDGTNGFTAKWTTNGNAKEALVCIRHLITAYGGVDSTTGANAAVHITYDSATTLQNDDFYIDVKYPDATDEAYGKWVSTKPSPSLLTAPDRTSFTDVSATETWNGTSGFTNPQEETVDVDFTGADGMVEIWGNLCKPSTTIYVDLLPDITAANDDYWVDFAKVA